MPQGFKTIKAAETYIDSSRFRRYNGSCPDGVIIYRIEGRSLKFRVCSFSPREVLLFARTWNEGGRKGSEFWRRVWRDKVKVVKPAS